jgi:selenocysteine lyase/cysteine desulfurase
MLTQNVSDDNDVTLPVFLGALPSGNANDMPPITRRDCLVGAGAFVACAGVVSECAAATPLIAPSAFAVKGINLNGASHHPLPVCTANALRSYADARSGGQFVPGLQGHEALRRAIACLAGLMNANVDELMLVPSATYGENMLVSALGIAGRGARVVSDILHFKSSLYQYGVLAGRGLDFTVVPMRNGGIELEDLDRAITPGTDLVSVSLVSYENGFTHDIKALSELAHKRGALLYVDVTQGAGAVPLNVKVLDIDACACSGFKWLMGESGAGFLYVRRELHPRLQRVLCGYHQLKKFEYHAFPLETPSHKLFEFQAEDDLNGHLAIGSISNAGIVALATSLEFVAGLGVQAIEEHRQPLLRELEISMAEAGIKSWTPAGSRSPIATYIYPNIGALLGEKLDRVGINVTLATHRIRVSPSVYNSLDDIAQLTQILREGLS